MDLAYFLEMVDLRMCLPHNTAAAFNLFFWNAQ